MYKTVTLMAIPLAAALVYGSWAAYANHEYGSATMLSAGLGQGGYAFFSTWIVTWLAQTALGHWGTAAKGMTLAFLSALSAMVVIPVGVHWLLKTPDMWQAITPGLVWGTLYVLVYIARTRREISTAK